MAIFSLPLRTALRQALGLYALRSRYTVLYREHLPLCPGLSVKWTCSAIRSLYSFHDFLRRSQWLRCLKRRSLAARLKELRVRIPPGAWMSVCCVGCCQVYISASGWSHVQRSPTGCDREAPMRRLWPDRGCCAMECLLTNNCHNSRNNVPTAASSIPTAQLFLNDKK
jgi:hypothetical protein